MPSYTLSELMSHATLGVGRRSDLDASYVSFKVNEAIAEVAETSPRAQSETTAWLSLISGSASTTLPSNFHTPILFSWMSGGSGTTLEKVSVGAIDSYGTAGGIPEVFAYFGTNIEVRPVPNSNLTIHARFYAQLSDLTALDSVPSLSTPWRRAALLKAQQLIASDLGNTTLAAQKSEEYLNYVNTIPSDDARRQSGINRQGVAVVL